MEYPILPPPRYFQSLSRHEKLRVKIIMLTRQVSVLDLLSALPPPGEKSKEFRSECARSARRLPELIEILLAAPSGLHEC